MSGPPDLTVVIPMHNAGTTVGRLIETFRSVNDLSIEIIAVDDASTDDSVAQVEALASADTQVLRSAVNQGAGVARNYGFVHARGTYTLFFDADDQVRPAALIRAVTALTASAADVAFLPYRYRRGVSTEFEGMNSFDQTVWSRYTTQFDEPTGQPHRVATLADVPRLLGFSNYPWNKVIRTERFVQTGLRFGATPVHNDILGHWMTLLNARSIVLVDDPLCTHIVTEEGTNLTNRQSEIRLTLFDALDETYSLLESRPALRNRYSHHYWDFVLRVAGWAAKRIDAEHLPEFNVLLQRHLLRMNLVDFSRIRQNRDPGLANRIVRRVLT